LALVQAFLQERTASVQLDCLLKKTVRLCFKKHPERYPCTYTGWTGTSDPHIPSPNPVVLLAFPVQSEMPVLQDEITTW